VATVTFLVHPKRADALALASDTAAWLQGQGHDARILRFSGPDRVAEGGTEADLEAVDLSGSTVAVSLGGDGTFLRVVRLAAKADVPVLGVNFGRLGYLPDLGPDQVRQALTTVFEGKASIEERCALEVTISDGHSNGADRSEEADQSDESPRHTDERPTDEHHTDERPDPNDDRAARFDEDADRSVSGDASTLLALNEVVIQKIAFGHTVRLTTTIDGESALTYSADGLIVATPTGSTAYNLSAGGPILAPTLRAMVVTPVAPHFSLDRSLVLTEDQEVGIEVVPDRAAALVIDGTDVGRLRPGSTVHCVVAERPVRVVRNEPQTFGGILRFRLLADRPQG
jgi:NAD+ kinase